MALGNKMISNQWKWTPEIIRNGVMVVRWSYDNLRRKNLWIWTKTQKGLNMSAEGVYDQWKNKYVLTNSYWRGHDKGQNDDRIEKWEQKDDSARKWLQNWWCSDCRRRRAAGTGSRSRGSRSSRSRSATCIPGAPTKSQDDYNDNILNHHHHHYHLRSGAKEAAEEAAELRRQLRARPPTGLAAGCDHIVMMVMVMISLMTPTHPSPPGLVASGNVTVTLLLMMIFKQFGNFIPEDYIFWKSISIRRPIS